MYIEWLTYACIGVVSGFLAGLLGIGGGVVAVPALFFFMGYFGAEHAHLMHVTIATSLASMIFSALSSVISHNKRKTINWSMARNMLLGLIIGSAFGAYIAQLLSSVVLARIFGAFLALLSIRFFIPESKNEESAGFQKPHFFYSTSLGFAISSTAALLGLGGGLFTVPVLRACKMRLKNAIGTSAAVSFLITLIGSISYFLLGLNKLSDGDSAFGFIYLPAFIMISICSFLCAPLGVKAIHTMQPKILQNVFGCVLLCVGAYMILRSFF